jgi:hypothetical protein
VLKLFCKYSGDKVSIKITIFAIPLQLFGTFSASNAQKTIETITTFLKTK